VPFELIERAVRTAGTAPSGANMQPRRFVVVRDAEINRPQKSGRNHACGLQSRGPGGRRGREKLSCQLTN
jgi:hypothetical protein